MEKKFRLNIFMDFNELNKIMLIYVMCLLIKNNYFIKSYN